MFQDIQAALVAWLEAEQGPGKRLRGVNTVRSGDRAPLYGTSHPLVTVDFEDTVELEPGTVGVTLGYPFAVCLYTQNIEGPDAAREDLWRLLWSVQDGADVGLLPSLLVLQTRGLSAGGLRYFVRMGTPQTGRVDDDEGLSAGALVPVTAVLQRGIPAN